MVRLRDGRVITLRGTVATFQFQYGAIKRMIIIEAFAAGIRFNSSMVRLRVLKKQSRVIRL